MYLATVDIWAADVLGMEYDVELFCWSVTECSTHFLMLSANFVWNRSYKTNDFCVSKHEHKSGLKPKKKKK